MTTKTTKAATIGVLAVALAITLAYSAMILPASAQAQAPNPTTSNSSSSSIISNAPPGQAGSPGRGPFGGAPMRGGLRGLGQQAVNLTVGQTITITSTSGKYLVAGNHDQNG